MTDDIVIPPIDRVEVVEVRPGDVILTRFAEPVSDEVIDRALKLLKHHFPHNAVVVTDGEVEIKVLRNGETKSRVADG